MSTKHPILSQHTLSWLGISTHHVKKSKVIMQNVSKLFLNAVETRSERKKKREGATERYSL